ncbi:stage II sporulation protein P [Aquibacillus kalidii]|uniref:stage II sporulation protein P n=1 Tax=Aquibacillus kalidii TaxID=2762597 RepID=UPI001F2266CE|nr:stage II sporulation protein P [Aquibacillus kalidii]
MQTDKELIKQISDSYDLEPRDEFIEETKQRLIRKSRKINYHNYFKKRLTYFFSTTITLALMVWLLSFNGAEFVVNTVNSISTSVNSNKSESQRFIPNNEDEVIFIYHTHNRESFFPSFDTNELSKAFHKEKNIVKVGGKLASTLQAKGLRVIHDDTDIMQLLKDNGMQFSEAYSLSRKIVKKGLEDEENIQLFLDIHRGADIDKDKTSTSFKGKIVPKISFIISKNNKHYQKNLEIAKLFYEKFQEKYPGISKVETVEGKTSGIYNQDLSSNALLIEIGGVSNTLEEEYKGAELLANVVSEVLKEL